MGLIFLLGKPRDFGAGAGTQAAYQDACGSVRRRVEGENARGNSGKTEEGCRGSRRVRTFFSACLSKLIYSSRDLIYIQAKLNEITSQHALLVIFFRGLNED